MLKCSLGLTAGQVTAVHKLIFVSLTNTNHNSKAEVLSFSKLLCKHQGRETIETFSFN